MVYVKVDPSGEDSWKLDPVVELLKEGAVGVIPTDTVYVASLSNKKITPLLPKIKNGKKERNYVVVVN